ncbi:MAG: dTMP kinase [Clostridia bacterium]|nr:dTMP kinase [Clostridia bacterium]
MKKGLFITIEGGEACGKSTQVKLLKEFIATLPNKDDFIFVREPGGTLLGEEIRKLLLDYNEDKPLPMTELLLFCAARHQIAEEIIKPALKQGKIVIADRFYDSTIAYQSCARGIMSIKDTLSLTRLAIGDLKPDKTFYFKLSPEEAFKRKSNCGPLDRIELEGMDFHEKVAQGYDCMANLESDRFITIDASKSIEEVASVVQCEFNKLITPKHCKGKCAGKKKYNEEKGLE